MIKKRFFKGKLNTPTHFTEINGFYFIVDCWNNRILFKDVNKKVSRWNKIENLYYPHRIRYFNEFYYVCDTDNNRILQYDKKFSKQKSIETIKMQRPHDIQFYNNDLYIVDCYEGISRLFKLNITNNLIEQIYQLNGIYARSFKIINSMIYISCSSSGEVVVLSINEDYKAKTYFKNTDGLQLACINPKDQEKYTERRFVPNDIDFFGDYFYISNYFYANSKNKLIRAKSLEDIENGIFEDLSHMTKGVPYYFEVKNDLMFMGEIDDYSCVRIFHHENKNLKLKKVIK